MYLFGFLEYLHFFRCLIYTGCHAFLKIFHIHVRKLYFFKFTRELHWYGCSPVCAHVSFKRNILIKGCFILVALKWFLSSMCPHVAAKLNFPWKCHITLDTLKWFLSNVYSQLLFPNIGCIIFDFINFLFLLINPQYCIPCNHIGNYHI